MQVDLSKAKAGDTVVFRCGGRAPIEYITQHSANMVAIQYHGQVCLTYQNDGRRSQTTGEAFNCKTPPETPFDITEVIPAPVAFDWSTAKWGMAFQHKNCGFYFWWIGKSKAVSSAVFMIEKSQEQVKGKYHDVTLTDLTRCPEHDIKEGV